MMEYTYKTSSPKKILPPKKHPQKNTPKPSPSKINKKNT